VFSQSQFQALSNPVESLQFNGSQGAQFYPSEPSSANGVPVALQREINPNQKTFSAYGEGYVAVNGERFSQPIVVTAQAVLTNWEAKNFDSLESTHFDYFLSLAPEVLLLGTGVRQHFAEPALFRSLIQAGIGIEFMDTHAACRTYNILVAEDRKVVAAVLL
jgi:uncharacterized protein